MEKKYWYCIDDVHTIDSPALVVFPERVRANVQTAIRMAGEVERLRPHVKTNKSAEVTRLMMQAGIRKFKCATIAEAEMLGMCGANDVLLAYQPLGPKLQRLVELVKKYPATRYSCLVDNLSAAEAQSAVFAEHRLNVPVFIDLNTGMNRTGITGAQAAVHLYMACSALPGIEPVGLQAYDGHIRQTNMAARTAACDAAFLVVEKIRSELEKTDLPAPIVIAGGSPTFPIHARRKNVECSPGTFIYWDKGYSDACPEQDFLPAAVLITRIISLPAPNRICTDLGHKSVAAENELSKRVFFLNANDLMPIGQSEEHLVLEAPEGHGYQPGDVLYALPFHICPTVALYERVLTVENGQLTGDWKNVARDRKINI
ncbi:MAG: D-TA family PLP-dependent enzyme [Haliscomenobacteraceae bacterium CHB4]|nr:D-threonine aldolase [Saprospiraceae bacterium]MCE7922021.1 D-TA family PLP-dependent enzyme [Haliscomenobacteraceae bacterium CHB4]